MLRHAPLLTTALFVGPILAGLVGTLLPSFGYLPALGGETIDLGAWRDLLLRPGLDTSLRLTVVSGVTATLLSLAIVCLFCSVAQSRPAFRRAERLLAPVLAIPHAALAIGLVFLIAPSGWIVRALSPWATGWTRPPDLATVNDPWGAALILGLLLKEVPFLLLMTLAALGQVRAAERMMVASTLGYGRVTAWFKGVFPLVYPQLRLPVYAVLAFSLSTVDVALILGPGNPPPLSPLVVRWLADRDVALYFPAAAGACLQLLIVVAAIALWRVGEAIAARIGRRWIDAGGRGGDHHAVEVAAFGASASIAIIVAASIVGLVLWSLAATWRFPRALPDQWALAAWERATRDMAWPLANTLIAAFAATAIALALVVACLENEQRRAIRPGAGALWLLYAPLLVPQTAFLFGVQVALVWAGLDGTWAAVIWSHLLFVVPYMFLSLADPWRALDPRFARTAACLGAPPWRVFLSVKLPILLRPLLVAAAVGFSVSVGQYLTTLFAGAGRFATLTTEAVTLAAGGDRRVLATYALAQAALPLLIYAAALALPTILYRNRRALAVSL
ncbi:MAG: ABC transporter permease subunit [Alphaproteobacteria bacterium]|nr:ABC transporter permease subunit [Alphaproteobacteria bacterium]